MEKSIIVLMLVGVALIGYGPISNYFISDNIGDCKCDEIQDFVTWAEGKRACVYKDSLGIETVGIGFNLRRSDARGIFTKFGIDYDAVFAGKKCLSEDQISMLFNNDLIWAESGAKNCVPSFDIHHKCIQTVLVDMTFNMGKASLCKWPNFVSQLANKDYTKAADNMSTTKWCGQAKRRCKRNTPLVRECSN